jgi:hypothetical protein
MQLCNNVHTLAILVTLFRSRALMLTSSAMMNW